MKYTDEEITEAYKQGNLYLRCLYTISDEVTTYNIARRDYDVMGEAGEHWLVETETESYIEISKDDTDFELVIKE